MANPPAVGPDGVVYISQSSNVGGVAAVDTTGKVVWKSQLAGHGVPSGPVYSAGLVFITAYNSAPNVYVAGGVLLLCLWPHRARSLSCTAPLFCTLLPSLPPPSSCPR
jgi:outer membrane protein assembly factor BamB